MSIRGFLFKRTWIPPRLFRSSAEELEAMDRERVRRNEKWYTYTRYLVVLAVIIVLISVLSAIIMFYFNTTESSNKWRELESVASIQAHPHVGKESAGNACVHGNESIRCDGKQDCKDAEDEERCVALSERLDNFFENKTTALYSGFVLLRVKNDWHPYCSHEWSDQLAAALCRREFGYATVVRIDVKGLKEVRYSRPKRNRAKNDVVSRTNLVILPKGEFTVVANNYQTEDFERYADCSVAYISCSNEETTID